MNTINLSQAISSNQTDRDITDGDWVVTDQGGLVLAVERTRAAALDQAGKIASEFERDTDVRFVVDERPQALGSDELVERLQLPTEDTHRGRFYVEGHHGTLSRDGVTRSVSSVKEFDPHRGHDRALGVGGDRAWKLDNVRVPAEVIHNMLDDGWMFSPA